ncbi:hypothetical protein ACE193_09110 [Bernardetia sp. OM2101]|uniref:hypothetical protein n=1 Tax=Bernardetia sp. OM2101 TaxID=3344876 RepID=UPI0035CF4423
MSITFFSCSSKHKVDDNFDYYSDCFFPNNGILEFKNLNKDLVEIEVKKFIKSINNKLLHKESDNITNWIHEYLIEENITTPSNGIQDWVFYNEDKSVQMHLYFCDTEILELGKELNTDSVSTQFQISAYSSSESSSSESSKFQTTVRFNSMFKHKCITNLKIRIVITEKAIFENNVQQFISKPISDTAYLYTYMGVEILTILNSNK